MSKSLSGHDLPRLRCRPPGPVTRAARAAQSGTFAPMGPMPVPSADAHATLVMQEGFGANVSDVDGNVYVDLAGGFGALLLGHCEPRVSATIAQQSTRLTQALGDVYPSDRKLELGARLARSYGSDARVILGQSGSDAVTSALKTARLFSERSGVLAFSGAYHGLGYGPLALCGLRSSYRDPFTEQLNQHASFVEYPSDGKELASCLESVRSALARGNVGAVLVEPILGRGGVVVPPRGFVSGLAELCRKNGAVLVADEIWTGLGRAGRLLFSSAEATADLICLGKGLGGGLPISAVIGRSDVMQAWQRPREVVHTSTFAGNPLAAATALTTLDILERDGLVARSEEVGKRFRDELRAVLGAKFPALNVRGAGLMVGIDLGARPGFGSRLQEDLLGRGYITSTGGGSREVLVLTPPLNIDEGLLAAFSAELLAALTGLNA